MNIDFFKDQDFKFTEVVTALERFYYTSEGKFFINAITPLLSSNSATDINKSRIPTNNILNYNSKLGIASYTLSNYIPLHVPIYMTDGIRDTYGYIEKGTQFIITFVGGDINKPRIMGVY